MNGKVVRLSKGQLVTGRKALAANIGTTESKAYRSLKLLQELGCISIEVNSKFSLVTIENWGKFQGDAKKVNSRATANQQQTDSRTTAEQQQSNTNKNDNNVKELYNDRMIEDAFTHSPEEKKLKSLNGEIGGGVVLLSDEQVDKLLEELSVEEFDKYVAIVRDCELSGKHFKKPHYQAIMEMVRKDRG
jgi:hypothetical protein